MSYVALHCPVRMLGGDRHVAHVMRLPVPSAKDGWNPQKLEEARKGPSPEAFRETRTRRCPGPKLPSPELWEKQCPRFADASLSSPARTQDGSAQCGERKCPFQGHLERGVVCAQ